ncbi:MAG: hypothetical protein AB7G93_12080 [Bdellovibrionales bacterium]
MALEKLDLLFPFLVFLYGVVMVLVLNTPFFITLSEDRLPHAVSEQIKGHRGLAWVCLFIGAFWSLQNLWL